jgi:surface antigen/peptidoglycan hydrolase CwlO-like protein
MTKQTVVLKRFYSVRVAVAALALALLIGGAAVVHADKYDEQIKAISADSAASSDIINGLESQAGSYQEQINRYQAQINQYQAQISANEAKQAALQQQIVADKQKMEQQRQYLGEDIRTMYVDGQLTTIEELATSKSLSDYVDKEEYRTAVQNKVDSTIKEIAALQEQLQKQKSELDHLLASERQQNAQLSSAQGHQQQLLSYNQSQQDAYNNKLASNSSRIAQLRREQIAANARFIRGSSYSAGSGPACGGGYPGKWCNIPQDSVIDDWGMYNRECVSYTAFRVAASGRYMPYWGGVGNANQWPDDARAAHIPMSYGGGARPGDVAISTRGAFGHAMYVEAVSGNNVYVSQYNAALDGRYSTNTVSQSGLYFIHF